MAERDVDERIGGDRWLRGLVDLKGITKPPPFDGLEKHWAAWKFRMVHLCDLIGIRNLMEYAERENDEINFDAMNREAQSQSKVLYTLLVQCCSGKALHVVQLVSRSHGFEA